VTIDTESPPGAWANEMKAAPWGYGQSQADRVRWALAEVAQKGLWEAARVLEQEIKTLRAEVEHLRK
jgi:hypothetical protein